YQAEVASLPGITKDDKDYAKVQRQILLLRRAGRLDYAAIADATRWMRKPRTHDSVEAALRDTAAHYRKALWNDAEEYVEIWCEKDALAGGDLSDYIALRRAADGHARLLQRNVRLRGDRGTQG